LTNSNVIFQQFVFLSIHICSGQVLGAWNWGFHQQEIGYCSCAKNSENDLVYTR